MSLSQELIKKRIIAYLIDGLIVDVLIIPVAFYIMLERIDFTFVVPLWITFVFFSYFYLSEKFWKKTIGKSIMNLEVKISNNSSLFKRTLARLIPFDIISFLINDNGLLWHDTLSNTKVIFNKKPYN